MTCTGFRQASLDSLVDICAADTLVGYGLVSCIHDGQILDVLDSFDGNTCLDPCCPSVSDVRNALCRLVNGVRGIREVRLDDLPSHSPRKEGQVASPLGELVTVDCIQRLEDTLFLANALHKNKRLKVVAGPIPHLSIAGGGKSGVPLA